MRKPKRKSLIKKLDKVFSDYIKERDGTCLQCRDVSHRKPRTRLTAGHLITRAKYSVRWDERNVFGQCQSHNFTHEFQPEHFTSWYIKKFGLPVYEQLIADSNQIRKFTNEDLLNLIMKYNGSNN